MAVALDGGCLAFRLREGEPLLHGDVKVWRHVGRERGSEAISLTVLEIPAGGDASWRNESCDEVLFVLSGSAEVIGTDGRCRVERDSGVFLQPNAPIRLANPGPEDLILVSSRCPDPGPRIRFGESGAEPVPLGSPEPLVVRLRDQPIETAGDGRTFRVLVDAKSGCQEVTQFIGFIPPGRAPDHFHEYEEVACILEGEGRFWSGQSTARVGPGWGLYLRRRQPHCVENTGARPLKLHGLFYPAGSPAVRYRPDGPAASG